MGRIEYMPRAKMAGLYAQRTDAHSTCLEGTRVGILSRIRSWVQDVEPNAEKVFLVSGLAGTGKSTIAQTIAVEFDNEAILGASFFFGARGALEVRSAELVITTLAYQLSRSSVEFRRSLADALEDHPDAPHELRARQIQKLLVTPLQAVSCLKPILIVLDAVDECVQPDAEEILGLLLSAVAQVEVPVKFLVTSRPEPFVASAFSRYAIHNEIVLHDIDTTIVTADIQKYLQHELMRLSSNPPTRQWEITEQDIDELVRRSGRLFVYAATAVRFIKDNRLFPPASQLKTLLDADQSKKVGALSSLDGLYLRVIQTAGVVFGGQLSFELVRKVLGAIVLLKASLSLESMERLLNIESGHVRAALYPFQSLIVTPKLDDQQASVYHQSFADFICDPSRCTDLRFYVDKLTHEQILGRSCFETMKRSLKRNIANIPEALRFECDAAIPNLDDMLKATLPDELSYACLHWAAHGGQTRLGDDYILAALQDFTTTRALWWLEAVSLLCEWPSAILNIQNAHLWAVSAPI